MIRYDVQSMIRTLLAAVARARGARQEDYVLVNGPAGGDA